MAARGLNGYAFGGDGRSTQDFAPNSWGLGFLGLTPGTVASPEGLLAGTYARDWALGWSPTALGMGALSAATRLPIGMLASLAGFRPDDYSVVGSLGGMSAPGGMAGTGAGGPGGGLGGHGGADQFAYSSAFGGNAAPATGTAPAPASPGRQYRAYTGDPYAYGQGGEHQFFTNNSLSSFRPTAAAPAPAGVGTQAPSSQQLHALLAMLAPAGGGNGW
ncbi:hypothetical protein CRT60_22665 [Azospirillum palustre]|uniref:Uncharacterized protein n=2 Tax=Azospirillum palustre TaxID=2044885 RepID=A0A2B8B5X3_9PROT|nr:hypothetical protein CRT60_22665 [Azospirillum palustre]